MDGTGHEKSEETAKKRQPLGVGTGDTAGSSHEADIDGRPGYCRNRQAEEQADMTDGIVEEVHGNPHDGGADDVTHDRFDIDDITGLAIDKYQIQGSRYADVSDGGIRSTGDPQGRNGDQEPVAGYFDQAGNTHVDDRNLWFFKTLQDSRRNLVNAEKADGNGDGPRSVGRSRRVVNKGNDWFGQHVEHDRKWDGDQKGDAHGTGRLVVNFFRVTQGETMADGRYEANGHGRRENRSKVDERYRHAREIPE